MAKPSYGYQYDTNPRKYDDYSYTNAKKNKMKKVKKTVNDRKNINRQTSKKEKEKIKQKEKKKAQFYLTIKVIVFFLILSGIIYRNTLVDENFNKIQKLKTSMTEIQKEINQLEINIQNTLNLNNIEQSAKELLGMQKLSTKQTVYISLDKKDYVESRTEKIIMDESQGFFSSIIEKIKDIL